MRLALRALWSDEQGQGLTEYALLLALVALGLIILLGNYRDAIGNVFTEATTTLEANTPICQAGQNC